MDAAGNLFIADKDNNRVREVNAATGIITTVAGNGTAGHSGDGGQATAAELHFPRRRGGRRGDLFIADAYNNRVREVNPATGVITTVAGDGSLGCTGDGGQATAAELNNPEGIAVDDSGQLFIPDPVDNRVREVNLATGIITTVAGDGGEGYGGDGGPATAAELDFPDAVAVDASGQLFIADSSNQCVREVNLFSGVITTVATGLGYPSSVAVDNSGDVFIADTGNNCVREVNLASGLIATIAGNGAAGFSGDGGPATAAEMQMPYGVAASSGGRVHRDLYNNRIRELTPVGVPLSVTPAPLTAAADTYSVPYARRCPRSPARSPVWPTAMPSPPATTARPRQAATPEPIPSPPRLSTPMTGWAITRSRSTRARSPSPPWRLR